MARHFIKQTAHTAHRAYRITAWISRALLKLLPPGLEAFLHHQFGARYFASFAGSFLLFLLYRKCALLTPYVRSHKSERFFLGLYALAFGAFCSWHFATVRIRQRRLGGEVHSYHAGSPWPFWTRLPLPLSVIEHFVEPVLCFGVALFISKFAGALGFWIKGSSLALFVKGQMNRRTLRRRTLDAMDARSEARHLNHRVQEQLTPRAHSKERFFVVASGQPSTSSQKHSES